MHCDAGTDGRYLLSPRMAAGLRGGFWHRGTPLGTEPVTGPLAPGLASQSQATSARAMQHRQPFLLSPPPPAAEMR
jgi:hypothetical protein